MKTFINYIRKSLGMSGLEPDLRVCYFTARLLTTSRVKTKHVCSDDMVEKELDIKLDITKKSRRINRPVQFADQHGQFPKFIIIIPISDINVTGRSHHGGGEVRH